MTHATARWPGLSRVFARSASAVLTATIATALTGCPMPKDDAKNTASNQPLVANQTVKTSTDNAAQNHDAPNSKTNNPPPHEDKKMNPVVVIETSLGTIEAELDLEKAPLSVANFLKYTDEGFYNGTIFHRVIPGFMIQGGGFTEAMVQKPTHSSVKNEAGNGLKNVTGTLAMARTMVVDSATAQFFINVHDNDFLNHRNNSPEGFGYAVFGKVISGMDVVDKIRLVPTGSKQGYDDVPKTPVVIKSIHRKH
jgi:cyclophilin family peptidyl-prolyl cis-trans isomerase